MYLQIPHLNGFLPSWTDAKNISIYFPLAAKYIVTDVTFECLFFLHEQMQFHKEVSILIALCNYKTSNVTWKRCWSHCLIVSHAFPIVALRIMIILSFCFPQSIFMTYFKQIVYSTSGRKWSIWKGNNASNLDIYFFFFWQTIKSLNCNCHCVIP